MFNKYLINSVVINGFVMAVNKFNKFNKFKINVKLG